MVESLVTRKDQNLAVFQGRTLPRPFFQPRFEPWFAWCRRFGTLPEELARDDLRGAYDRIDASMRSVAYYTGQPDPICLTYTPEVSIREDRRGNQLHRTFATPHGDLTEVLQWTVDETWRTVEYPARSAADLRALRWLVERRVFRFDADAFRQGAAYLGDRGVPQFWVPKSPYLALGQQLMRFEDFVYAIEDCPHDMASIMDSIDRSYDALYSEIAETSGLVRIVNFGENVASAYLSPLLYERYMLPWYHRRSTQLRAAGIYTHIHIDGYFRPLLPYLASMPFDGLEALTPKPQGDVSLQEIRDHIGEKILLDGIPAVLFLAHMPMADLVSCTERVVELFHPRLVLGISDELPEGSGPEGYRRMKMVARWCTTGRWEEETA